MLVENKKMIVSTHIPKTAGLSFYDFLRAHFTWHFKGDYHDVSLLHCASTEEEKFVFKHHTLYKSYIFYLKYIRQTRCIHGHFLPYKYISLKSDTNTIFITWLRDPVERVLSHYYFYQRLFAKGLSKQIPEFQKKMLGEKWTLRDFVFNERFRNIYKSYIWRFPLENFNFIGITEHFEEDLKYFAQQYLGIESITIPKKNTNPNKQQDYLIDDDFAEELKAFNAEDYKIYNKALEMRRKRMKSY